MSREVMQMALDMLNGIADHVYFDQTLAEVITALERALGEKHMSENKLARTPADDGQPVAWMHTTAAGLVYFRKKPQDKVFNPQAVYIAPPKQWVGLTDEERERFKGLGFVGVSAVEAKLKEKNT